MLSIVTTYAWTGSAYVVPSAMAKAGVLAMTRAWRWSGAGAACGSTPSRPARSPRRAPGSGWCRGPTWRGRSRPGTRWAGLGSIGNWPTWPAILLATAAGYINGEVVAIDGGEWLRGAGQFNFLDRLSESDWEAIKPKK